MQRRNPAIPIFFLVFFLTLGILFLSQKNLLGGFGNGITILFSPIRSLVIGFTPSGLNTVTKLQQENEALRKQIIDQRSLQKEDKALKDQFQTTNIPTTHILPAHIIGKPSFIPGFTMPESFILDKGTKDGVRIGQAVVYQNNAIGKIVAMTDSIASVALLTNKVTAFTAKTSQTNALGIIKGQGNGEMILDTVVLSDHIKVGDSVITNGDVDQNGSGYVPGLIVGKVISVDKTPSALFQSANVKSLIDFTTLTTVFVVIKQ